MEEQPEELQFLECQTCGALVLNTLKHDAWFGHSDGGYTAIDLGIGHRVIDVQIVKSS